MDSSTLSKQVVDDFEVCLSASACQYRRSDEYQEAYCPPIDPSLLRSILLDYNDDNVEEARSTLDILKHSALAEEQLEFDASGSAGFGDTYETGSRTSGSHKEASAGRSTATDLTSVSNGLEAIDLRDDSEQTLRPDGLLGENEDLDQLDEETKLQVLASLFGDKLPQRDIQYTLRSCHGKFHAAMEQLLNQVYFQEANDVNEHGKVSYRGIDAFSEDNMGRRSRKGKPKGKNRRAQAHSDSNAIFDPALQAPTANRWQTTAQDVAFITSRTGLSTATVSPIYHKNGASLPETIAAVLDQASEGPFSNAIDAITLAEHTRELESEFPSISPPRATTLVQLTHPSTSAAHELAKAMTSPSASPIGGIQIIPKYAPVSTMIDAQSTASRPRSKDGAARFLDLDGDAGRLSEYSSRSQAALSQASNAHRLAKSNPLMGGAAAYYAQVRREYSALAFQALADVADGTAEAQSSQHQLDLHNIDVANAVRIARSRVEQWWSALGENRVNGRTGAGERAQGYTIVVGRGIHSQGGKPRIAPAVSRMLREEGWKFESSGAVLTVKGRASGR